MCELLGMSANVPTDIRFSFAGLMRRGGATGPHQDGWGIAFYERKTCRLFLDPSASANSEVAQLVSRFPIKSRIVISHIRRANRGRTCLENTHPFTRELWGRVWSFAHNGQLRGVKKFPLSHYLPIGTTDSEHAFCWLLGKVRARYPRPPTRPAGLWKLLRGLAGELNELGVFNFLLSDASYLYAHCSNHLCWLTRKAPFGKARLIDADMVVDFQKETTPKDIVTVIATRPLTDDEVWEQMARNEFRVFHEGTALG